jgi:hypothetical protein
MLFSVTAVLVITGFVLYILIREQTFVFSDTRTFTEFLKTKTDLRISEDFLYYILYAELQDHLNIWHNDVSLMFPGNVSVLLNFPIVLLFVYFWTCCFLQEKQRYIKLFFILPVLLFLYHIPVFFMFTDYGRYMIMISQIQFMLVFYLIYAENNTVLAVISKMVPSVNKKWFIIILICSLMLFLGPVGSISPSGRIKQIFMGFFDHLELIKLIIRRNI